MVVIWSRNKAGRNIYRAEHQAYQKRKRNTADRDGSIDAVTKCTDNQRSTGKDRERDTAYTGVTAKGNQKRIGNNI